MNFLYEGLKAISDVHKNWQIRTNNDRLTSWYTTNILPFYRIRDKETMKIYLKTLVRVGFSQEGARNQLDKELFEAERKLEPITQKNKACWSCSFKKNNLKTCGICRKLSIATKLARLNIGQRIKKYVSKVNDDEDSLNY